MLHVFTNAVDVDVAWCIAQAHALFGTQLVHVNGTVGKLAAALLEGPRGANVPVNLILVGGPERMGKSTFANLMVRRARVPGRQPASQPADCAVVAGVYLTVSQPRSLCCSVQVGQRNAFAATTQLPSNDWSTMYARMPRCDASGPLRELTSCPS